MTQTIALAKEQLDVELKTFEKGTVSVATQVIETDEVVALPLKRDEVEIERVTINRVVEHASPPRQDGDVTVIAVYEEVLVVTKQLILKEELRIRRRSSVQPAQPQTFKLRREKLTVTRSPTDGRG